MRWPTTAAWTLPAGDVSPALANGTYYVTACGTNTSGQVAYDSTLVNELLTVDTVSPTVTLPSVATQTAAIGSVGITFSEPVSGFSQQNLQMTLNGVGLPLDGTTLTTSDDEHWTLGNLSGITGTPGAYSLTVSDAGWDVTDAAGNVLSTNATTNWTEEPAVPTVLTNPTNQTVMAGNAASFTATANGYPTPTVQWDVNTGSGFTALSNGGVYSGATTTTLTISGATAALNGYRYEAVFTNTTGIATSSAATLTVDSITAQPVNRMINAGQGTTFTAASSIGADTVQWDVNTGSGFSPLSNGGVYSGVTTTTLTINGATAGLNGDRYEAVFTNTAGTLASSAATLTVDSVTTQPVSRTIDAGQGTTFTAASSNPGGTDTVQWEVNAGSGFALVSNGGVYSGATTKTLTINGATGGLNGYSYEAAFTNTAGTATSTPAMLTVDYVSTQPVNRTVNAGQGTTFAAASSNPGGTDTVQWEVNTGSGFALLSNSGVYSGVTTKTLTISAATAALNGYEYEAVFTNTAGTFASNPATLTVNPTVGVWNSASSGVWNSAGNWSDSQGAGVPGFSGVIGDQATFNGGPD